MKLVSELMQDENFIKKVTQVKDNTMNNHILVHIDDEYTKSVYLILLLSIADAIGDIDDASDNPISYICKINAALPTQQDIEELYRYSLRINESTLEEYCKTLQISDIQAILFFDALTMVELFGIKESKVLDYIAGLAVLLSISEDELSDISFIAKTIICRKQNFIHTFHHAHVKPFLQYFRSFCQKIMIDAPDVFIIECKKETDVNELLDINLVIENKNYVSFHNIYLHDKRVFLKIQNCSEVKIDACRFEHLTDNEIRAFIWDNLLLRKPDGLHVIDFNKIDKVSVTNCTFSNMIHNLVDVRDASDFVLFDLKGGRYSLDGIVGFIEHVSDVIITDNTFVNCYILRYYQWPVYYGDRYYEDPGDFLRHNSIFPDELFFKEAKPLLGYNEGHKFLQDVIWGLNEIEKLKVENNKIENSTNVIYD